MNDIKGIQQKKFLGELRNSKVDLCRRAACAVAVAWHKTDADEKRINDQIKLLEVSGLHIEKLETRVKELDTALREISRVANYPPRDKCISELVKKLLK